MRLHDPAGPGLLTRVIRMGPSYITPRGDGRYVIGATSEERGFDTTVTAGAVFELLRDASELVPGVSELVLDEFTAGLRPATPDNLPVDRAGDGATACTGRPATAAAGSCWRRSPPSWSAGVLAGEAMPDIRRGLRRRPLRRDGRSGAAS